VKVRIAKLLVEKFPTLPKPVYPTLLPYLHVDNSPVTGLHQKITRDCILELNWNEIPDTLRKRLEDQKIQSKDEIRANIEPRDLNLDVLYEDEHLIFVNKTAGLVVHSSPERHQNFHNSLINGLLFHCPEIAKLKHHNSHFMPGIVHRLDTETSGVLVVAKTERCFKDLLLQFTSHENTRLYLGLCHGRFSIPKRTLTYRVVTNAHKPGLVVSETAPENSRLGDRASTTYKILRTWEHEKLNTPINLVQYKLATGRTHQIRVHMKAIGKPIVNDRQYAVNEYDDENFREIIFPFKENEERKLNLHRTHFLHAHSLQLTHPITMKKLKVFAHLPNYFHKTMKFLHCLSDVG